MRGSVDLLTFDFGTAPVDTMPTTPMDELEAARAAHREAEAAEVRARAAYDAASVAAGSVTFAPVVTPEVQVIRMAFNQAREDLRAAFRDYAASARVLSQALARARA